MKFQKQLLLTKILVSISIIGSFGSYYTIEKGWGALYPFTTYKLYSQPIGSNHKYTQYRIYASADTVGPYTRMPVRPTSAFDEDEYRYTLIYFTDKVIEDRLHKTNYKERLKILVNHLVPGQVRYKIVLETYNPKDLLKSEINYDTTTVVSF